MHYIASRENVKFVNYVTFCQDEDNVEADNMEEDVDGELADIEALNYDDLDNVSKLQKTQRYIDIMQVCSYIIPALLFEV